MEIPIGEYSWGHLHKVSIRLMDNLMLNCCRCAVCKVPITRTPSSWAPIGQWPIHEDENPVTEIHPQLREGGGNGSVRANRSPGKRPEWISQAPVGPQRSKSRFSIMRSPRRLRSKDDEPFGQRNFADSTVPARAGASSAPGSLVLDDIYRYEINVPEPGAPTILCA